MEQSSLGYSSVSILIWEIVAFHCQQASNEFLCVSVYDRKCFCYTHHNFETDIFIKSDILNPNILCLGKMQKNSNHLQHINVIDKPVDAIDMIHQKSLSGYENDVTLYICNISDIVQNHQIWKGSSILW